MRLVVTVTNTGLLVCRVSCLDLVCLHCPPPSIFGRPSRLPELAVAKPSVSELSELWLAERDEGV